MIIKIKLLYFERNNKNQMYFNHIRKPCILLNVAQTQ
jgi:hypothetical protein